MKLRTSGVLLAACLASATCFAQASAAAPSDKPADFPGGAQPLAQDELKSALTGKVYSYGVADGTRLRLDFRDNGFIFVNSSRGFNSSGPWRVEGSSVCTQIRSAPQGCAEVRKVGDKMYMRRLTGDVVELMPG